MLRACVRARSQPRRRAINVGPVHRVGLKTQPESKCPELLANYCDMLLRKTPLSKKLTSEEIEAKLKEVVRALVLWLSGLAWS